MKAVVFHGIGDIRLDDVPEPKIEHPTDAIVRLTASAICGTDLHLVRGTMPGVEPGTVLGHEGVGIVEEVGADVRNLSKGHRVVIPSTIACGTCAYCRGGYYAQCDEANPNGRRAGTAFYGGPATAGGFAGLQAEYARIPYAHVNLVRLPDEVSDNQAILISDVFPTGYFGAELADVKPGRTVVVFGCGPVGLFAIASAKMLGAGRVFAVDQVASRLDMARETGAEVIDFSKEDPVETILRLTGGIGVDRAIDAVGVDAERPHTGPAVQKSEERKEEFERELNQVVPHPHPKGDIYKPGDAPSQTLDWAIDVLAKAGRLAIIGVYPQQLHSFPIGQAMMKNLMLTMGNCNHRKYVPSLVEMTRTGAVDPTKIITHFESIDDAIQAYESFDRRRYGWIKVGLAA